MKILITGASGFIGSQFITKTSGEHKFFSLGRPPSGVPHYGIQSINCDLTNWTATREAVEAVFERERIDAIVHLAVSRLHRTFPATAEDLFLVNTALTANLLDLAHRGGVQQFILGSTCSVYNVPYGVRPTEADFLPPKSFFAATKLNADELARQYRGLMQVAILRFSVPFGPGLVGRMLNQLEEAILDGRPVEIPLNGPELVFSPVHVDDTVTVIRRALAERWNQTVNVANGEAIALTQAAQVIASIYNKDVQFSQSSKAGSFYMVPDVTRLHRELMPNHSFTSLAKGLSLGLNPTYFHLIKGSQ